MGHRAALEQLRDATEAIEAGDVAKAKKIMAKPRLRRKKPVTGRGMLNDLERRQSNLERRE
jgi:iron uptake system EfeUOB component EfeO/EfeM